MRYALGLWLLRMAMTGLDVRQSWLSIRLRCWAIHLASVVLPPEDAARLDRRLAWTIEASPALSKALEEKEP